MLNRTYLEKMLAECQDLKADALRGVQVRMGRISESMAFYRGNQHGFATDYDFVPDFDDEERKTINYTRPAVRSNVALLLRSIPRLQVVSALEGPKAMARAMRTDRLVKSMRRNGMLSYETFLEGETDIAIKGLGFYKVFWNPRGGKMQRLAAMRPTEAGGWEPDEDEDGNAEHEYRFEGAPKVEYVDCVDALIDPHANTDEEIRHVFHRKVLPVSLLEAVYPQDVFGEKTKGRFITVDKEQSQLSRDAAQGAPLELLSPSGSTQAKSNQAVELVEAWFRPCEEYPGGFLLVYAGNVIVGVTDELPYDWPWVARVGSNRVPRSMWADGVVQDLKPMQRMVNDSFTRAQEILDLAVAPKILSPADAGLAPDAFDDRVGQVLIYDGMKGKPEWMQFPSIPPALTSLGSDSIQMMRDVAAVSDVTDPSGLQTGRALAYLEENKKGVLEPEVEVFRLAYAKVLKLLLGILRDFMPEGRLLAMLGENNSMAAVYFKREDYDFDAELVLEQDEGPTSRAVRSADALQILQAGGLTDDPAAKRFRQLAGRDWVDQDPFSPEQSHRMRAIRESGNFLSDPWQMPPQMVPEDDHEVHLTDHKLTAVSEEFLALPPAAQQVWRQHIEEHEMAFVEQHQADAVMNPAPGGGPPPPGQPQAPSPFDGGVSDSMAGLQTPPSGAPE